MLWWSTVVREAVEAVRQGLSLGPVHLLGHSWLPGTAGRLAASLDTMLSSRSYQPMWEATSDLPRIHCPTLIMCGRHDVATPTLAGVLCQGIAEARLHVFENSAHFAMEEEPAEFHRVVQEFLDEVSVS